jgi:hypothetical protein
MSVFQAASEPGSVEPFSLAACAGQACWGQLLLAAGFQGRILNKYVLPGLQGTELHFKGLKFGAAPAASAAAAAAAAAAVYCMHTPLCRAAALS